jgi:MOSC domain-containing protein YiiM
VLCGERNGSVATQPASTTVSSESQATATGRVEGIFITTAAGEPMIALHEARAIAGQGLEDDRYLLGTGFYSDGKDGRQLTLIEAEALEALAEGGVQLAPHECRRNLVTRGVGLNDLVGKRFRVGEIECLGVRLCPPCNHLEELTRPGMLRGLAHTGGLRAHILTDGVIALGDPVG